LPTRLSGRHTRNTCFDHNTANNDALLSSTPWGLHKSLQTERPQGLRPDKLCPTIICLQPEMNSGTDVTILQPSKRVLLYRTWHRCSRHQAPESRYSVTIYALPLSACQVFHSPSIGFILSLNLVPLMILHHCDLFDGD